MWNLALLWIAQAPTAPATSGWKLPPEPIVRMLDAAPTPQFEVAADGLHVLVTERAAMPTLSELARPWLGLGGMRVDPARHAPQDAGGIEKLALRTLEAAASRPIPLPEQASVGSLSWSPDSKRVALSMVFENKVELWLLELSSARLQRLAGPLQATVGEAFGWWSSSDRLWVKLIPEGAGPMPSQPAVPSAPATQESSGKKTALRTYQDLLQNSHDEALFEYFTRAQLAEVKLDGTVRKLAEPGLYANIVPSPDGQWLLTTRWVKPFSYVLPMSLFPARVELLRKDGTLARSLRELPLGDDIPPEGVRQGPRDFQWQQSADATLWWLEAQDGGDPRNKSDLRDRWFSLAAPFEAQADARFELEHRAQGIAWLADGQSAILREYDRDRRWTRSSLARLDRPQRVVIEDRSQNDRYGDPGTLLLRTNERGARLVRQDGEWCYRRGEGAAATGARPFLDRVVLGQDRRERLWQCEEGWYEAIVSVLPSAAGTLPRLVTLREAAQVVPNYQLRDLAQSSLRALSDHPDPCPEMRGVSRELVKYKRADGVDLSATLYLPAGYQAGTRLPLFVWAYPMEFNDAATAGQVAGSPHRFVRVRGASHLFLLTQGYAVMDNATMPIVGEPETMNDTFLDQIVAASQAAIDFAANRGVADPKRVGVGGHSYGAFMTANLLAHCDLFRAGIARSGAYNRTLTPFGFQSERRTIWEAPQSYLKLSPFLSAEKINEPLLLIHGEKDNNMGTFPIQSERMFQALQGNGGQARLVMLPHESHGYRSREAVLHTLAEMIEWLDRWVKN